MADAGGPACALGIVPRCSTFRGLVALYRSGYPLTTAAPPGGMYIEGDMKLENNKQQTNKEGFPAARPSCRGMPPPPSAAEAAEAEAARRAEKARRAEEATRLEEARQDAVAEPGRSRPGRVGAGSGRSRVGSEPGRSRPGSEPGRVGAGSEPGRSRVGSEPGRSRIGETDVERSNLQHRGSWLSGPRQQPTV